MFESEEVHHLMLVRIIWGLNNVFRATWTYRCDSCAGTWSRRVARKASSMAITALSCIPGVTCEYRSKVIPTLL